MFHDVSRCFMMFHDASWCFIMFHDGSWCFIMVHVGSWFMVVHDVSCLFSPPEINSEETIEDFYNGSPGAEGAVRMLISSYIEHPPTSAWFYQLLWWWSIAVLDSSRTLKESTMLQCIICNLFNKALYFRDPRVALTRYTNIPQICLTSDELAMLFSQPQYFRPHATPSYGVWF